MKTAMETGIAKNDILITQNGNKIEVTKNYVKINGKVTAGETLVDGLGIGDIGSAVIKDRQQLSQDGIVVVAYTIERKTGKIIAGPEIATRGFVYMKDAEELIKEASDLLEARSEEHTSELQSRQYLVCRLLLEKKNNRRLL